MNPATVNIMMDTALEEFVCSKEKINHCLYAYKCECQRLIDEIGKSSRSEAEDIFNIIFDFTGRLSRAWFVLRIDIGADLEKIVREFERLHDPYIRDYWFQRFKDGERWPT